MPRFLRLALFLGIPALVAACDQAPSADLAAVDLGAPLSPTSLYHYDATWQTDAETPMKLADLRGRPVLLAMVYADCGTACPMIIHDMKRIAEQVGGVPLRHVLVTLDPERDTPEHLRRFRQMHELGTDWTLLRGSDDAIQTLAALLGVRYRADADGTIAHSNLITLLDAGGDVAAQQEGLGADPAPAVAALLAATRPTR